MIHPTQQMIDDMKDWLDAEFRKAIFQNEHPDSTKENTMLQQQAAIAVPKSEWTKIPDGSIVRIVRVNGVVVHGPIFDGHFYGHLVVGQKEDPHYVGLDKIAEVFIEVPATDPDEAVIEEFAKALKGSYDGVLGTPWARASESTRAYWRGDARRFLAAIDAQRAEEAA